MNTINVIPAEAEIQSLRLFLKVDTRYNNPDKTN